MLSLALKHHSAINVGKDQDISDLISEVRDRETSKVFSSTWLGFVSCSVVSYSTTIRTYQRSSQGSSQIPYLESMFSDLAGIKS